MSAKPYTGALDPQVQAYLQGEIPQINQLLADHLAELQRDDEDAWLKVATRMYPALLLNADRMLRRIDADIDHAQEAVETLLRRLPKKIQKLERITWKFVLGGLAYIVGELYKRRIRPERERRSDLEAANNHGESNRRLIEDQPDRDQERSGRSLATAYYNHLEKLSEAERRVIDCRMWEELTIKETAEHLSLTPDQVRTLHQNGVAKLSDCEALARLERRGGIPPMEVEVFRRKRLEGESLPKIETALGLEKGSAGRYLERAEALVEAEILCMRQEFLDEEAD